MAKNKDNKGQAPTQYKSIDIMSILGFIVGTVLIYISIIYEGASKDGTVPAMLVPGLILDFYDVPSIFITIGGTISALMLSFPLKIFTKVGKHLKIVIFPTQYNPMAYVGKIVEFATSARIEGILSLEKKIVDLDDEFLKNSLMLVVDSVDPQKVRQLLDTELDYLSDRHSQDRKFYERGASFAPAFGMIGTLIGLVKMLAKMGELGADGLGPAMSVALITTFYGTVMANMLFGPMATKLKVRHDEEILCKMIIIEGIEAIQAGENPRYIEEKLLSLVSSSARGTDTKSSKKSRKQK